MTQSKYIMIITFKVIDNNDINYWTRISVAQRDCLIAYVAIIIIISFALPSLQLMPLLPNIPQMSLMHMHQFGNDGHFYFRLSRLLASSFVLDRTIASSSLIAKRRVVQSDPLFRVLGYYENLLLPGFEYVAHYNLLAILFWQSSSLCYHDMGYATSTWWLYVSRAFLDLTRSKFGSVSSCGIRWKMIITMTLKILKYQ